MSHFEDRTVPATLTLAAERWPNQRFLVDNRTTLTYEETIKKVREFAAGLRARGVQAGDRVLVMMDNHCDFPITWFAINYIGGTIVTANTAYKGDSLQNVIENSEATTVIAEGKYLQRLSAAAPEWKPVRVIVREAEDADSGFEASTVAFEEVPQEFPADFSPAVKAGDPAAIIFTSGTTGRSKGVIVPHGLLISFADPEHVAEAREGDVVPVMYPIYYIGGIEVVLNVALVGATAVIFPRFSATTFWKAAKECGATYVGINGTMMNFLNRQPPSEYDRAHGVRRLRIAPVLNDIDAMKKRFNIDQVSTCYGMTEASIPIVAPFGRAQPGALGWARHDFDVRIFDSEDRELPDGEIGEIVVRPKRPYSMMLGYTKQLDVGAMWRNLWLHTGDLGRRTSDGEFFYVDRVKDSIRRRGENVSSQEVESYIYRHDAVLECAVVAVPDEVTSADEIKAYLTIKPGETFDFREFITFLAEKMPAFWVPRYVEIIDEMPKSDKGSIIKRSLRSLPQGDRFWDREQEGIVLKR